MYVKEFFKNGNLALQVNLDAKAFLEVSLVDGNGNLIYNFCEFTKQGTVSHLIEQNYLPGNEYFVRVAANGNSVINKMIPGNLKMAN